MNDQRNIAHTKSIKAETTRSAKGTVLFALLVVSAYSLSGVAAIGFPNNRGVVHAKKRNGRHDMSLDSNRRAFTWHTVGAGVDPDDSRPIIDLIDAVAESADGLRDSAGNHDLFVHEPAGIRVDLADASSFATSQSKA
jgi:hypothetical protein